MYRNASVTKQNMFIFVIIAFSVLFEMQHLAFNTYRIAISISLGLSVGYYLYFKEMLLTPIIISASIIKYIGYIVFFDIDYITAIPLSLLYLIQVVVILGSLRFISKTFHFTVPKTIKHTLIYLFSVLAITVLSSLIPSIFFMDIYELSYMTTVQYLSEGPILGILIYATLVLFSSEFDPVYSIKYINVYYILFFFLFAFISIFILFIALKYNLYIYLAPIMLVLFMVHSFFFSFRSLAVSTTLFAVSYSIIIQLFLEDSYENVTSSLNLLLFSIMIVTIITKVLFDSFTTKQEYLEESKRNLESIMNSIFELFKTNDFSQFDNQTHVDKYMNKVFQITTELFPKASHSVCIRTIDNTVNIIDTKGYSKPFVESLQIQLQNIIWDYQTIIYDKNSFDYYQKISHKHVDLQSTIMKDLKESVRFVVPLNNNQYGGISLDIMKDSLDSFSKADLENIKHLQQLLISFYERNELLLQNSSLKDDIVYSLIKTLEIYDHYTGGHSEDVAYFSKLIAEHLNLSSKEIYNIYWAGIVHDIGKIGVSPGIINKDGKLTLEEYNEVKNHSKLGHSILSQSNELKDIALLVRHHHEWFNGSGYPDGLKGKDIPFGSQILCVADAVSAMATNRSYQKKKSLEEIKEELLLYKNVQFNKEIVDVMIHLIDQGIIKRYYQERTDLK
jgi:HD-GYP domain-containing protein (c-di-GMP phosphodiesterase class II)